MLQPDLVMSYFSHFCFWPLIYFLLYLILLQPSDFDLLWVFAVIINFPYEMSLLSMFVFFWFFFSPPFFCLVFWYDALLSLWLLLSCYDSYFFPYIFTFYPNIFILFFKLSIHQSYPSCYIIVLCHVGHYYPPYEMVNCFMPFYNVLPMNPYWCCLSRICDMKWFLCH